MALYKVNVADCLVAVTDDETIIKEIMKKAEKTGEYVAVTGAMQLPMKYASEVDIFVNDEEKDYGYSFIYPSEKGYSIELWQTRLCVSEAEGNLYDWHEVLSECGKCYGSYGNNHIRSCVEAHYDFWMESTPSKLPMVNLLSIDEATCLLKTGFKAQHIFAEIN